MFDEPLNNDATQPLRPAAEPAPAKDSASSIESTTPVRLTGPTQPNVVGQAKTSASAVSDTIPDPDAGNRANPPSKSKKSKTKNRGRGWLIAGGILFILLVTLAGSYLGYGAGIQERLEKQSSQVAMAAATQFQLGLDDMNAGRYEMARGRFEYIIKLDPNFPGVKSKLSEAMIALIPTEIPTATFTPTPEYTPTPDMRGEEGIFQQILVQLAAQKWDTAIVNIESLRTKNLKYKTVDVDGFYYIALRYRGVDKILRQGDLEGGMYDLALAERFGPLDRDADSYRLWARYYVTGASFWQVDWEKATFYFGQVAPMLPNLRDSSNILAVDRYREAASRYAEKLAKDGDNCKASQILDTVFINNYKNATFEPQATNAYRECHPPTETPQPTKASATPTLTSTLTRLTPGGTSLTPSVNPTGGGSATNTPNPSPTAGSGGTGTATPSPTLKPAGTKTTTPSPTPHP